MPLHILSRLLGFWGRLSLLVSLIVGAISLVGCPPSYVIIKREQIQRYPAISPKLASKHMFQSMQRLKKYMDTPEHNAELELERDRESWVKMIGDMLPLLRSLSAYDLQQWLKDLQLLQETYAERYHKIPPDLHRQIGEMQAVAKVRIEHARNKAKEFEKLARLAIEQAIEDVSGVSEKILHSPKRPRKIPNNVSLKRLPSLKLLYPLPGHRIGSDFRWRKRPKGLRYGDPKRKWSFHTGVDMGAKKGTPILAADSGTVIRARWMGSCGYGVIIKHRPTIYRRLTTIYCHMSRILVREKQHVKRGQRIGRIGSTGNSTGPHLHFGININGKHYNPKHHLLPDRSNLSRRQRSGS
jgi:murein DD-endopeptidase MepM/ murein hydrolase activator NlpD